MSEERADPDAGQSAPNPPARTKTAAEELSRRKRRIAHLAAAWRALAHSTVMRGADQDGGGDPIRQRLIALTHRFRALTPDALDPAELKAVDREVRACAGELREGVLAVPLAQLRSTLPRVAQEHRQEVVALLDTTLARGRELERSLHHIDYLLTLLCTAEDRGQRRVCVDPVGLSSRLQRLCGKREQAPQCDVDAIEREFLTAAGLNENQGAIESVLVEMRERKEEIGADFFVPRILRAVMVYNATLWNRVEERIDADRESAQALGAEVEAVEIADEAASATPDAALDAEAEAEVDAELATPPAPPEVEPEPAPALETDPGIAAIVAAVRGCLGGDRPGFGPADRIAARLNLRELSEAERTAVAVLGEPPWDPVGAALLMGLLIQALPVAEEDVAELGIDLAALRGDWLRGVDQALQKEISTRTASGGYEDACTLAQLRTDWLYAALSALGREARQAGTKPPPPAQPASADAAATPSPTPTPAAPEPRAPAPTRPKERAPAPSEHAAEPETREKKASRLPRIPYTAVVALIAVVLVPFALVNYLGKEESLGMIEGRELHGYSPHLESAYRDQAGEGGLFVGTLGPTYPGAMTAKEVDRIVDRLKNDGARQIMIYDQQHRLALHYENGELLRPR